MTDWQVGDLALCVRNGRAKTNPTRAGKVYEVKRVWENDGIALDFVGIYNGARSPKADTWRGHDPDRFRKITPGADIEGIEAEKRIPVPHLFPVPA